MSRTANVAIENRIGIMSDAVLVAIITVVGNLVIVSLGRWMSHSEHRKTNEDVREIKNLLNGKGE